MRVTFYTAVLVVAVCSVILGLDWVAAPMPPMPEAKNIVFAPPPPPPPPRVAEQPASPPPQSAPAPQVAATPAARPQTPAAPQTPAPTSAPVTPPPASAAPKIKCDVDACAAAYRSFRESDCTYNPSFGPRRLCTKGDPERYAREHPDANAPAAPPEAPPAAPSAATPEAPAAQTAEPGAIVAPEPGALAATPPAAPPRCNVAACASAYPRSFRESDCTFNPNSGPRRVCEK